MHTESGGLEQAGQCAGLEEGYSYVGYFSKRKPFKKKKKKKKKKKVYIFNVNE